MPLGIQNNSKCGIVIIQSCFNLQPSKETCEIENQPNDSHSVHFHTQLTNIHHWWGGKMYMYGDLLEKPY